MPIKKNGAAAKTKRAGVKTVSKTGVKPKAKTRKSR